MGCAGDCWGGAAAAGLHAHNAYGGLEVKHWKRCWHCTHHRPSQLMLELLLGSLNVVQDEQHAVLVCQCMQLCSLWLIYAVVFNGLPISSSVYVNKSGAIYFTQAMAILFDSFFPVTNQ
jgi:hypothetical protein